MARKKKVGGKINIDDLVTAVMDELDEFGEYVSGTAIRAAVKKTSEYAVEQIQGASPRKSGKYASNWTSDIGGRNGKDSYTEIVYNDKRYMLTHLLEKGHRKRGGGRVAGITHIAPVEAEFGDKITEFLKSEIEG